MKRKIISSLIFVTSIFGAVSCGEKADPNKATFVNVKPVGYEEVATQNDMDVFLSEVRDQSGNLWEKPLDYGFVTSVWHKLTINGVEVPVYSTRCLKDIHSWAYVDIDTDGNFKLDVDVTLLEGKHNDAIILPEKSKVNVKVTKNDVDPYHYSFTLKDYGDYSLCFGDNGVIGPQQALTIYIAKERKDIVPEGYQVKEIEPGTYDDIDATAYPSLRFSEQRTYYRFKKGVYSVNSVLIPDNSILYFEPGCYFKMRQDDNKAAFENAGKTFKILGRCIVDYSAFVGGSAKSKLAFSFASLTEGAYTEGLISINSNTWTMMYTASDKLEICYNMIFGFREFADGIMLSGCTDSYVHHNFARTGDDAIEAKATTPRKVAKNNLLYEYNSVWNDRARAYGVIFESTANITGVTFRHNSVGFAQNDAREEIGCLHVHMGTNHDAVWSDIHFEDFEVYYSRCAVMNIFNASTNIYVYGDPNSEAYGGTIKDIYFKNIRVKRLDNTNPNLAAHMLRITCLYDPEHPEYIDHMKLGKIYVDDAYYGNLKMDKTTSKDYLGITLPEDFTWSTGNIKWNTNPEVAEVSNPLLS